MTENPTVGRNGTPCPEVILGADYGYLGAPTFRGHAADAESLAARTRDLLGSLTGRAYREVAEPLAATIAGEPTMERRPFGASHTAKVWRSHEDPGAYAAFDAASRAEWEQESGTSAGTSRADLARATSEAFGRLSPLYRNGFDVALRAGLAWSRCAVEPSEQRFEVVVAAMDADPVTCAERPAGVREPWLRYACWVGVHATYGTLPRHLAPRRGLLGRLRSQ